MGMVILKIAIGFVCGFIIGNIWDIERWTFRLVPWDEKDLEAEE